MKVNLGDLNRHHLGEIIITWDGFEGRLKNVSHFDSFTTIRVVGLGRFKREQRDFTVDGDSKIRNFSVEMSGE
jgi:hypothetical protein